LCRSDTPDSSDVSSEELSAGPSSSSIHSSDILASVTSFLASISDACAKGFVAATVSRASAAFSASTMSDLMVKNKNITYSRTIKFKQSCINRWHTLFLRANCQYQVIATKRIQLQVRTVVH
jgi:hypothetical protein